MKELNINGKIYVEKGSEKTSLAKPNKKGLEYCIIRTYSAGVFAGWIDTKSKDLCQEVFKARRLWRFWSEFTLSALAKEGIKKGKEKENKYAMPVDRIILKQIIEIIPCTEKAKKQIIESPNYSE
jgi:hypothetical protein